MDDKVHTVFHMRLQSSPPLSVMVMVKGIALPMEVDTGAAVSLISVASYRQLWPNSLRPPLQSTDCGYESTQESSYAYMDRFQLQWHIREESLSYSYW